MLNRIKFWEIVSRTSFVLSLILLIALKFILTQEQKDYLYPLFMPIGIVTVSSLFFSQLMLIVLNRKRK
jgi:hypothetical protein